jgi:hypothetical protein
LQIKRDEARVLGIARHDRHRLDCHLGPPVEFVFGVKHFLEDELGREVDLTTRGGLHPLLKDEIEREAVRIL